MTDEGICEECGSTNVEVESFAVVADERGKRVRYTLMCLACGESVGVVNDAEPR